MQNKSPLLLAAFILLKVIAFFAVSSDYDFHRDELLYLALGSHLDWGYWSNPPMIGALGAVTRMFPSHAIEAVRLFPLLASVGTLLLAMRMARVMGGGLYAEALAGLAILVCPPYLRTMVLFQPVAFDIFFWALCSFLVLQYLKSQETRWLWWLGAALGLGLMLKYLLLIFAAALVLGLLLTPHRQVFGKKEAYLAAALALLVWSPNLIWQATHGFPVFHHLNALNENQLVHVKRANFLIGQLLAHLPALLLVLLGVVYFFTKTGRIFRVLGWVIVFTELILLICRGKDYYALGLYPLILAAGAVYWETRTAQFTWRKTARFAPAVVAIVLGLALAPFSMPCLPVEKMIRYCTAAREKTGISGPVTWEDGELHELPQDYADMLGWRQIANLAQTAWEQSPDKSATLIYGENYGQAAAVDWYGRDKGLPPVLSFSDTYLLWAPDSLSREVTTFIYINDDLGDDVQHIFADIRLIGTVDTPHAREFGTRVYLCQAPRESFRRFYRERIGGIKRKVFGD